MRIKASLSLTLALLPVLAGAQGNPVGPEFRVNSYTLDDQNDPAIALDPLGNFVVVWQSRDEDGSEYGVFAQRYDSGGVPLGAEFRVNTFTSGHQIRPSVAADAAGNFVVVWYSAGDQDGSGYGVFGQRYSSAGAPVGPEFRVNSYITGNQQWPAVAADPTGAFVVTWYSPDGSYDGIFAQRFASSGAPLGPEFRVNTYTTGTQRLPSVAADSSGNFVVAWESYGQDGGAYTPGVFAQRFASTGAPLGAEFRANTFTTSVQSRPSVAAVDGQFLVVWYGFGQQGGTAFDVFGQRFDGSGAPLGPEFRVNTVTADGQILASVAADPAGNFVVAWQGGDAYTGGGEVGGQRFLASGVPAGSEFRVNTFTTLTQGLPAVATDPNGNFVVVWNSNQEDGAAWGVFGQRFGPMVPVELTGFGVE